MKFQAQYFFAKMFIFHIFQTLKQQHTPAAHQQALLILAAAAEEEEEVCQTKQSNIYFLIYFDLPPLLFCCINFSFILLSLSCIRRQSQYAVRLYSRVAHAAFHTLRVSHRNISLPFCYLFVYLFVFIYLFIFYLFVSTRQLRQRRQRARQPRQQRTGRRRRSSSSISCSHHTHQPHRHAAQRGVVAAAAAPRGARIQSVCRGRCARSGRV